MNYDIAIVGGGVAGYFAALQILENNKYAKILMLEKMEKPLLKLLTTGSGACNFSHSGTIEDFLTRYGSNGRFLRNAFNHYFVDDIICFFENNNIKTFCRDDGKYFPLSMKAQDIKNLLLNKTKDIKSVFNVNIQSISKDDDLFIIKENEKAYYAHNVLITTGGKSFPKTGSTGDGYTFAQHFGHTITSLKPSLASIYCRNHELSNFSGISFTDATIIHKCNNKDATYSGALLITHKGLSGPVIIDNSRSFMPSDTLVISFINAKKDDLEKYLQSNKNETIFTALKKYTVPKKLIQFLCDKTNIDSQKKLCEISKKSTRDFVEMITSYTITISAIESFETCMCTSGGVSLKEVSPKTFESKIIDGLYFLGEVLDIDGDSGGYNLQAIWSQCALFANNFSC